MVEAITATPIMHGAKPHYRSAANGLVPSTWISCGVRPRLNRQLALGPIWYEKSGRE